MAAWINPDLPNNNMNSWMKAMGIGSGAGTAAGGFAGMFGKGNKNPGDVANSYLDQIPEALRPYFAPYMNAGQNAMGSLQGQYSDLLSGDVYNRLGEGYKESPGYQFKLQEALGAGNNAAAAGGMLGTPAHEQQNMQLGNDIASQDFNDYLMKKMGLYGLGLQGQQGLNQMGFDASKDYATNIGNTMGQKAQYAYAGQNAKNQAGQQDWSNIFSGISSMLPFLFM